MKQHKLQFIFRSANTQIIICNKIQTFVSSRNLTSCNFIAFLYNRAFKIMEFQTEFSGRLEALERRFEGTQDLVLVINKETLGN